MVLREDCKAKLMSWRRVNSFCMFSCVSECLDVQRVYMLSSLTQGFLLTSGQNEEKSLDLDGSRFALVTHVLFTMCVQFLHFE